MNDPALASDAPPTGPAAGASAATRSDRIASRVLTTSLVLLVIAALMQVIRVPYAVESPGPATNTLGRVGDTPIVRVDGARTYPTGGELLFTTVRVQGGPDRHLTMWQWLRAHLDADEKVVPEERVFGTGRTEQEIEQLNTAEMQGSQRSAVAVALRSTGVTVPQRDVVASIASGLPASGLLELRDQIVRVDGQRVTSIASIIAAISDRSPGESVDLTVRRGGTTREVSVPTADLGGGRAGIGVGLEPLYTLPYAVDINAGDVGGPSAGMMFALAVRDVVTPGEMTGGQAIAGTGTIDDQGQVGPIGGIQQKMIGARASGARWFLAPRANCQEVRGHVPAGMSALRVGTFEEAVRAVEGIAKGATADLPTCG